MLAALEGLSAGTRAPTVRPHWTAAATVASALAATLLAGLLFGLNVGHWRERLSSHSAAMKQPAAAPNVTAAGRRCVAVVGFKNLSQRPDEAWLGTALAEMLTTAAAAK